MRRRAIVHDGVMTSRIARGEGFGLHDCPAAHILCDSSALAAEKDPVWAFLSSLTSRKRLEAAGQPCHTCRVGAGGAYLSDTTRCRQLPATQHFITSVDPLSS